MVIERTLFLGSTPRLVLDKLLIGETVQQVLECDLRLQQEAMPRLHEAIAHSENVRDFVSRDLFATILKAEGDHVDFLETQLELIGRIGIENYIQLQSGPVSAQAG